MEVRCIVCGRKLEIAKWHPEYEQLRSEGEHAPYICERCSTMITGEAREAQQPKKPL